MENWRLGLRQSGSLHTDEGYPGLSKAIEGYRPGPPLYIDLV